MRVRLVGTPTEKRLRAVHQVPSLGGSQGPAESTAHAADTPVAHFVFFLHPTSTHECVLANRDRKGITISQTEDPLRGLLRAESAGFDRFYLLNRSLEE